MRALLAVAVALTIAVGVARVAPTSTPETVALPPPGSLTSAVTSTGTPVWIGHRRDDGSAVAGDVWVVDASAPDGLGLVAYCPATGQLVDAETGDRFDPRGRVVEAATDGLTPLRHEVDGDVLRIVERLPAYPNLRLGAADTAGGSRCADGELQQHVALDTSD